MYSYVVSCVVDDFHNHTHIHTLSQQELEFLVETFSHEEGIDDQMQLALQTDKEEPAADAPAPTTTQQEIGGEEDEKVDDTKELSADEPVPTTSTQKEVILIDIDDDDDDKDDNYTEMILVNDTFTAVWRVYA